MCPPKSTSAPSKRKPRGKSAPKSAVRERSASTTKKSSTKKSPKSTTRKKARATPPPPPRGTAQTPSARSSSLPPPRADQAASARTRATLLGMLDANQGVRYSEKHRKVLHEALFLIAERGCSGASLRELAQRLGIRQPSLYHYFDSKEDLFLQILQNYISESTDVDASTLPPLSSLTDMLRYSLDAVAARFKTPEQASYVRFLISLGQEYPDLQTTVQKVIFERVTRVLTDATRLFAEETGFLPSDSHHLSRMVIGAMISRLHDHHVIGGHRESPDDLNDFRDFLIEAAVHTGQARKKTFDKKLS